MIVAVVEILTMNKNKVIEELSARQGQCWRNIELLYAEAVKKMYALRQCFDLKHTVSNSDIPAMEWSRIQQECAIIDELESLKRDIKAHKRESKRAEHIDGVLFEAADEEEPDLPRLDFNSEKAPSMEFDYETK